MTHETFNKLLDELEASRVMTLKEKNARYSDPTDALHNFAQGAEIMSCTPAQCAWNYATKHIVALRDMIMRDNFSNRDDVLEKIQDIQNYLSFIWCIANDNPNANTVETETTTPTIPYDEQDCDECYYSDRPVSQEPCSRCKHNMIYGTDEYETATSLWKEKPYVANKPH